MPKTDDLITYTQKYFQKYYSQKITMQGAEEIIDNFLGFSNLLLKLDRKRQTKQRSKNNGKK